MSGLRVDLELRGAYLYGRLAGEFSLDAAHSAYRQVLQAAARDGRTRILLDVTAVRGEMTISDRLAFGAYMAEEQARLAGHFPALPQIGILAVPPIMDPGRFTQTVANNRGVRMRASESLQELLSWLEV